MQLSQCVQTENAEWDVVIKVFEHRTRTPWDLITVEHGRSFWKLGTVCVMTLLIKDCEIQLKSSKKLRNGILSWNFSHDDSCCCPCYTSSVNSTCIAFILKPWPPPNLDTMKKQHQLLKQEMPYGKRKDDFGFQERGWDKSISLACI